MSEISPELVERMVKVIRELDDYDHFQAHLVTEATAIAALLPKPVDPDLIEARGIAERHFRGGGYSEGRWDGTAAVTLALEGVRRGRELANDGWIVWRGGECPCPGHKAEYLLRSGAELGPSSADFMEWRHEYGQKKRTGMGDILAYRIIKRAEGGV